MKSTHLAIVLITALWLAFAGYVWLTTPQLPARVATHFGVNGVPNGWMTRTGHLRFTLIFGTALPAFILAVFALIPRWNGWGLNIPHKDYWLAPERREATFEFVRRQGYWIAGFCIAFIAMIHHSILVANSRSPVALPASDVGWIAGPFLAAVLVWAAIFLRRFFRKSA